MKKLIFSFSLLLIGACTKNPLPPAPTTPTPTASASSSSPTATPIGPCNCMARWGIGKDPHNIMDQNHQPIDHPIVGGFLVYDTTERFQLPGGGDGPCDAEKDNCNGVKCSDPRGPNFVVSSPADWHVNSNPYQIKVGPLVKGHYSFKSVPRADLQDAYGRKVNVCSGDGADETSLDLK